MNYQPQFSPYGQFEQNNMLLLQKRNERKNIASISFACGGSVIAFVLLQIFIGALIALSGKKIYNLYETNAMFSAGLSMIISIISIVIPFFVAYKFLKSKNLASEIPLGKPYNKKDAALLIPIIFMVCIIGDISTGMFSVFVETTFGIEFSQPDDGSIYNSVSDIIFSFVSTAIAPALIEEFAIRGVVMQSLRRYGDMFAVVMSSFVFALMHGNMIQIPFAFIAGIGLGYLVVKTGSLWPSIIVHFINNAFAVAAMSINEKCSENTASTFMLVFYAVVFVSGIICLALYLARGKTDEYRLSKGYVNCLTTNEKVTQFILTAPMIIAIGILAYETSRYIN